MKKLIIALMALASINNLFAQLSEGTIYFERKQNMHRNLPNEQMKAMIPEFRTSEHILIFKNNTSLYKKSPTDELPDASAMGNSGGPIVMKMSGGPADDITYKDLNTQEKIVYKNFLRNEYLIVDSVKPRTWKLTDETKIILGYTCRKAITTINQPKARMMISTISTNNSSDTTAKNSSQDIKSKEVEVVAWFCEQINISSGPEEFGSLPGMILEIDIDNGGTIFNAIEIKKKIDKSEFVIPTNGKKVTQAEFTAESKKIMEEMQKGGGMGGMFRVGGN
ncbi:MAG: GLPGLI family protein [Chitinophagaceae bacterium]